ncbi:hypothetical protein LLE49_25820 [Alicyclobacillus tolerans]|uniref:hypothetical protein n=1 Tax=Alicyclobacillus tolerans TaxID=90970 RepID=UPI001F34B5F8|nr:hypothetical protein [Alicyclobacillus tolerans]MCF8568147.1 hypothetical protein [Alicyclobacillus tolerans]
MFNLSRLPILSYLNATIELILYLMMFLPLVYLTRQLWLSGYQTVRGHLFGAAQRRRLRTSQYFRTTRSSVNFGQRFLWHEHLQDLLESTLRKTTPSTYRTFLWFSAGLGAGVYVVLFIATDHPFFPLLPALLVTTWPYFILRIRRYRISIRNSYDIAPVLKELIPKYRAARHNMRHALPVLTQESKDQTPFLRALSRLHIKLERAHSPEHAKRIIKSFNAQTGTDWSTRLSSLIYKAYIENANVDDALVKLDEDMTDAQNTLKEQRLDRTDNLLLGILPIFGLPAGILFMYTTLTHHILKYQFGTPAGLRSFTLALTVTFFSAMAGTIFHRPKQDI